MKTIAILIISILLGIFAPQSAVAMYVANDTTIVNVSHETSKPTPKKKAANGKKIVKRILQGFYILFLIGMIILLIGISRSSKP